MPAYFDHEKLNTYQRSLDFVDYIAVLVRRKKIDQVFADEGKAILVDIVSLLVGLIRSQDTDRLYEERAEYNADRS